MNRARQDLSGTLIADGRYRLTELRGEGGYGQVYAGVQTALGKAVAIKLLAAEWTKNQSLVARFIREAQATAKVAHENVVEVYDFGSTGTGTAFIAMELMDGEELTSILQREGRLPWPRTRRIVLQICRALHAAHSRGVLHRDVKPENIYRVPDRRNDDFVKVLDFGLAKIFGDEKRPALSLSTTGQVFGTPEYMAPEQCRGLEVDERTDVYSVGVLLFEMLTGGCPFTSASGHVEVLVAQTNDAPPVPSHVAPDAGISPALDRVILRALEKDPSRRQQSMRELAEELIDVGSVAGPSTLRSRSVATAAGGGLWYLLMASLTLNVLLALLVSWLLLRSG